MLTDERLQELWTHHGQVGTDYRGWCRTFARAVEAEARREALEEAARICQDLYACATGNYVVPSAARCAAEIRALAKECTCLGNDDIGHTTEGKC